jgi:hypothetical protein
MLESKGEELIGFRNTICEAVGCYLKAKIELTLSVGTLPVIVCEEEEVLGKQEWNMGEFLWENMMLYLKR